MKKLILLLSFLAALNSFGQIVIPKTTPGFQQWGSPTTWSQFNGLLYPVLGLVNSAYSDTTTANLNSYLKFTPGVQIRVGDSLYLRNSTATGWINITNGSGSSYSFTNGVTESGGTVKLGGALTEETTIDGNTGQYGVVFDDVRLFDVTASSSTRRINLITQDDVLSDSISQITIGGSSGLIRTRINSSIQQRESIIDTYPDSIINRPYLGAYYIDTLQATDTTQYIVGYRSNGQLVKTLKSSVGGYWTGVGNDIYNNNSGNVGIGLSSPAFKLDVGGTSSVSDRKIGINGVQMMYLPDQATFLRSMFVGTGGNFLSHTTGDEGLYNMGFGLNALDSVTTGYINIAFGPESMRRTTTGFWNTAFGSNTLQNNISGTENAAFGLNALKNNTGDFNTAIGTSALLFNTTGQTNTAVGNQALRNNTTGLQNSAIGYRCLQTNTTGYFNTAVAYRALEDNTTGYGNTGIGLHALSNNTTGYNNSAIGFYAGDVIQTGRNNTFVGTYAGNNVLQKTDAINQTVIGGYAYGTRDFSLVLGSKDSVNVTELNGKDSLIVDATLTTIKSVTSSGTYTGRWKARVGSTTSSGTPTINTDNVDIYKLTAQAADITSFTTNLSGTPNDGDILEIQITGTAARAITWGSAFVSSTVTLPATTVTTATLTVVVQYFTTSSYGNNKWVCVNYF